MPRKITDAQVTEVRARRMTGESLQAIADDVGDDDEGGTP